MTLKQNLAKLSTGTLVRIGADLGCPPATRQGTIDYIVNYLRSYNLNWADLAARYQLMP